MDKKKNMPNKIFKILYLKMKPENEDSFYNIGATSTGFLDIKSKITERLFRQPHC
jgi:hypothetical protein